MRVLIDIRLLGRGGQSGIEEYTRQLVTHLLERNGGANYQLFYNGWRKQPLPSHWREKARVINWRLPNKIFDAVSRFFGQPKIDQFVKSDLIFSPHFNIINRKKVPRVLTIHDLSFIHHPYFFSRKQRLWHWLQNYKKQIIEADAIVAVSNSTKKDIIDTFGVSPEKVRVIYPGINPIFNAAKSDFRKKSDFQKLTPYLLYLGTIEPRKNVELIIKAFELLKADSAFADFKLVLAGKLGWLYQNILKIYNQSPFKKDIIFLGPVKDGDRLLLYKMAEVFIYPSFFEGFGLPPLEAQACGCPVIANNRTSLPEVLSNSATLVNPWNFGDLAEAIKNCPRQQLVEAGLKNVQRFNWQTTADQLTSLFAALA